MKKLVVDLQKRSYPILIERGILKRTGQEVQRIYKGKKVFVITDENVGNLYLDEVLNSLQREGYETDSMTLPPGEQTKAFHILPEIFDRFLDFKLTRSDLIIALGGGVIGDLAGFAASTFLRGVPYVQIPTSLLAQVDSSVGGKVAVDLPRGKNLVGSFYHPKLVLIDPDVLFSLPDRFFYDGMAEVIKYSCIKDRSLFEQLDKYNNKNEMTADLEDIIYHCCDIKRQIVEEDEKDQGNRMLLNFGHTIGHAIEAYYEYKKYTHGEAVAIGMYEITKRAEEKGLTPKGTARLIKEMVTKYQLPFELDTNDFTPVLDTIQLDKKNINNVLHVILLKEIGQAYIHKTSIQFFQDKE